MRGAAAVDSLGSGLVMTLGVLFFVLNTDVPLTQIGFAVAAGGIAALPVGVVGGWIIDSKGSKFGMVANNLLSASGFALFLIAQSPVVIFISSLLIATGDRIYWAAWTTYIHDLSGDAPYERLFGRLEAVKMAAMSVGAAVGAIAMAINSISGAYFAVILNILVTLLAALIYAKSPMPKQDEKNLDETTSDDSSLKGVLRLVISQRGFLSLTAGQFFLAPIMVLPNVALSVFFVNNWEMNAAVAPVIFGINAGVVAIFQEKITQLMRFQSRTRVIFYGVFIIAFMLFILTILPVPTSSVLGWIVVSVVGIILAVVDMLYMPATNALMAAIPDSSIRGKSVGIFQTSMAVGMSVYPSTIGLLEYNSELLWMLTCLSILLGGFCYWLAARRTTKSILFAEVK